MEVEVYDDNDTDEDYGYGDVDNYEDYVCGDYDNHNGDGEGHHGHPPTWDDSYFDIGDGSGNYSYGCTYLNQLINALTNHSNTVHVVDDSYVQNLNYQFRSPAFLFCFYSNGSRLAKLYVDLPLNASPLQSYIIDPHYGGSDGNNSSTICLICHRNRSFDDSGNIEDGEAKEGKWKARNPSTRKF
jgi:hypothetical protein